MTTSPCPEESSSTLMASAPISLEKLCAGDAEVADAPIKTGLGLPKLAQILRSRVSTTATRSEEHTSELQSRGQLVCRLLLEKKKHIGSRHGGGRHAGERRRFSQLGHEPERVVQQRLDHASLGDGTDDLALDADLALDRALRD